MSNRGGGMSSIPAASRKMVQSLKEIVNCPEPEIYAMLKECNMDPNEAVSRLLSQDTFHEVKSKREKKKENKDGADPRPRGGIHSNRAGRGGGDRYYGRSGSTQFSSNDSGALHNKPAYRKENGPQGYSDSSLPGPGIAGNSFNRRPPSHSESAPIENKVPSVSIGDSTSSVSQPASRSSWMGKPGQVSMADIVKMGRPPSKVSGTPNKAQPGVPAPPVSHHDMYQSSNAFQGSSESTAQTSQVQVQDEWPPIEQPSSASMSSVLKSYLEPESNLDRNMPLPVKEDGSTEPFNANNVGSTSVTSQPVQEENSSAVSYSENNDVYENTASYQSPRHAVEHNEAEDGVTLAAEDLQQLDLAKDDQALSTEEDNPTVVIPDHLQVHAPECSGLSFGSFRSGASGSFSGPFSSQPLTDNLEETSSAPDAASVAHVDARNTEYYGDENLRTTSGEELIHGIAPSAGDNDTSSVSLSQSEVLKQDTVEPVQGNQYSLPSDAPGYNYESSQHLNAAFSQPQSSSQVQNLAPFSNVMGYTHSLPGTLLSSNVQTVREAELSYSPFTVTQPMPSEYNIAGSSISGQAMSVTEALRVGAISSPQPTQQTLPGANVATGPTLPQQLAVHPFSQPTLPLGHFANMIGYSFLPQSYTYMPSAFQQGFAGNNTYHQLAAMLPQYKSNASVNNLPQSASVAAGYGLGSSTSIPGQIFSLNPPSAAGPGATTMGFDDVLSSRYKDSNQILSLQQQNENPAMWVHAPQSRTMSSVPANTYYNFQGQNQQPGGFRQNQQPSQHLGALGYPNFYNSQGGISLEQQQRDGSLGGSQGQQVKQSQQIWQNGY